MSRIPFRISFVHFLIAFTILALRPVASVYGQSPPSFQGLGALPGAQFGSRARAISDDGTAVTGNSDQSGKGGAFTMAYRWKAGVMTPLGDLPGDANLSESGGVSADGSALAGMSFSSNGTEAFRWEAGVMSGLGDLPGGDAYSHAFDISGDGAVVVGLSRTEIADFPFRWENGVMDNLSEDFPGGAPPPGLAVAASSDGGIVVGQVTILGVSKPFRWTGGVMDVLEIPADAIQGVAAGVSPDGQVIAGRLYLPDSEFEAFVWEAGQVTRLGDLPGGTFNSRATGVANGGGVVTVVGNGTSDSGSEAFVWTPSKGMRLLRDVFESEFNLDLTGWGILIVDDVSADGLSFTGTSVNPAGKQEAWIAHIGCARSGDVNNDGLCNEADIDGFIHCLLTGSGCGCGDFDGDQVVNGTDIELFLAALLQ